MAAFVATEAPAEEQAAVPAEEAAAPDASAPPEEATEVKGSA
jgi:hypothetical protein